MTLRISGIFPGHFLVMLFGLKKVLSSRIPTLFENKSFMLYKIRSPSMIE